MATNTTSSLDVFRTAQAAFPFAFKYRNFVYAGDRDFHVPADTVLDRLSHCRIGDQPAFQPYQFAPGGFVHDMAQNNLVPVADVLAGRGQTPVDVITDENLLVEYRHGYVITFRPLQWLLPENPSESGK